MRGSRLIALLVLVATIGAFAMVLTMRHQSRARKAAPAPAAAH
jgi:Flp pilus assembly protein CpaB